MDPMTKANRHDEGAPRPGVSAKHDAARMGSGPQHEQADLPALADREGVLGDLSRVIADAWASFDTPRISEPELDPALAERLGAALPEDAYDADVATSAGGADLVEEQALRWVADFVGFPLAEGAFTSGGMTSNLTALLAARERALPGSRASGLSGRPAAVYCSAEAHHSVVRAVEVAGLGSDAVRRVALDAWRRMRPDALAEAIAADARAGVTPVAV